MWVFLLITVASLLFFSLSHHLGLVERAYEVCGKIAACPMCSTFWGTLLVLLLCGYHIALSLLCSLAAAYLSNWVALLYDILNRLYTQLWQRRKKWRTPHR